jgi:transposase
VGGDDRRRGQHGDDVAHVGQARAVAKKKSLIAAERDEEARAAWRTAVARLAPADLVFLDETSTPTTLTPTHARVPRGVRAVGRVPHRRGHNVTLLAALMPTGIGTSALIEGATDRVVFEAFVAQ